MQEVEPYEPVSEFKLVEQPITEQVFESSEKHSHERKSSQHNQQSATRPKEMSSDREDNVNNLSLEVQHDQQHISEMRELEEYCESIRLENKPLGQDDFNPNDETP